MSGYVIINLADRDGFGPIASLTSGVTAKRTKNVNRVDAFGLLDRDKLHQLTRNDPGVVNLRTLCERSSKIYLATHGIPTDVDHAFAAAAGGQPLCTVDQLASFLLLILPVRKKPYALSLVMCYGARTATYRTAQLDHQGLIPIQEIRTSFAYKLFQRLIRHRGVRMTARTGAVAFDGRTGVSSVESELSIDARIDKEVFLRGDNILPTVNDFRAAERASAANGNQDYQRFLALKAQFEALPDKLALTNEERIIKAYTDMMRVKKGYIDIMEANTDRTKYGKIIYRMKHGQLIVSNKYADNGKPLLLYRGGLV